MSFEYGPSSLWVRRRDKVLRLTYPMSLTLTSNHISVLMSLLSPNSTRLLVRGLVSVLLLSRFGLALPGRFTKPRTTSHAPFKRIHRTDGEFPLATNTVATNKFRLEAMGRFCFLAPLPLAGTAQREGCEITQYFHLFIPCLFTRVKCL